MSIKHPRLNVTFDEATVTLLTDLAQNYHQSVASLVRELTLEALERREDFYLSKLADELYDKNTKTYSHEEAWA